jgi:hypothetical protein
MLLRLRALAGHMRRKPRFADVLRERMEAEISPATERFMAARAHARQRIARAGDLPARRDDEADPRSTPRRPVNNGVGRSAQRGLSVLVAWVSALPAPQRLELRAQSAAVRVC